MDLSNKKINLIVTIVVAVLVLALGISASITIVKYYNYETEFIDNPTVDHVEKLSKYSPSIEGTKNDIEIYVFYGTDNTVALVRTADVDNFATLDAVKASSKVYADGQQVDNVADQQALLLTDFAQKTDASSAVEALKKLEADVAIVSYADAKTAMAKKENQGMLAISSAEVERVPSLLLLGGTHPNEPSGQVTATLFMERIQMQRGKFFIITELNRSGFSYAQPQEGYPMYYTLKTANGSTRTFKFGSRLTNTVDQMLVPDVYSHSSGQQLSSVEVRNFNRVYPGSPTGTYTERCAYGIVELIKQNNITIEVDLHEASPEYMTNNKVIYHQDSGALHSLVKLGGYMVDDNGNKVRMDYDSSPTTMHGLTHREIGDYTNAYAFLCETCECVEGRIHGPLTDNLTCYYEGNKDKFYEYLVALDAKNGKKGGQVGGYIYVAPCSIDERVARHTLTVMSIVNAFNEEPYARTDYTWCYLPESERNTTENAYRGVFKVNNIPSYTQIMTDSCGYYLGNSQR